MTEYNFKISLKSLEDYFFGGERTFGELTDEEGRNYYAYSNPYPQQSSLLGLLRYLLLACNDCLPLDENRAKAVKLIGAKSFNPEQKKDKQTFGAIETISPLLMEYKNSYFKFSHPLSHLKLDWNRDGRLNTTSFSSEAIPILQGYDPKTYYPGLLTDEKNQTKVFDQIFQSFAQIGIKKGSEEKGFFKQQFYRLKDNAQFVFFAKIHSSIDLSEGSQEVVKLFDNIVFFGGEQRQFQVKVTKADQALLPTFLETGEGNKFTLLSDAHVPESIFGHCQFLLSDTEDFRVGLFKSNGHSFGGKSKKYNLLKRGSILFAKNDRDAESIKDLLDAPANFKQIGFNHYFQETFTNHDTKTE